MNVEYNEEMQRRVSAALGKLRELPAFESKSISRLTINSNGEEDHGRAWPIVKFQCRSGHQIDALRLLTSQDGTWLWWREPRDGHLAIVPAVPGERKEWWEADSKFLEGRILVACPSPKCTKKPVRKEDELLEIYAGAVMTGTRKVVLE